MKGFRKRVATTLAVLVAAMGMGAISASPASADQGDFGTQWVQTRNFVNNNFPCCAVDLYHWEYYGAHSRVFYWLTSSGCRIGVWIGHTYSIWDYGTNRSSGCYWRS